MSEAPLFYPGDIVAHKAWSDTSHSWENRQVIFRDYADGELGVALVEWGQHSRLDGTIAPQVFRVPVRELSRPAPKPPAFAPPPQPSKPGPPAAPDLAPLRQRLRDAHSARAEAEQKVDAAAQLVSRAEQSLSTADAGLAAQRDRERQRVDAVEAAIRNGNASVDVDADYVDTARLSRDADATRAALERFREELRIARVKLAEVDAQIRGAALRIVVAIVSREGAALAALEREAARRRVELRAVDALLTSDYRTSIPNALAELLASPPHSIEDPVGLQFRMEAAASRTARWKALLSKLSAGDAEAELE